MNDLTAPNAKTLADTLRAVESRLEIPDDRLDHLCWHFHPRFRFFKTVPYGASLLDMGAGPGGLQFWRVWGEPQRTDLKMYAVDQNVGEHFGHYDGWEQVNLDEAMPVFDGIRLNAFVLSHLIEHLAAPQQIIRWIAERGEPGCRIYIEWPSPWTVALPQRDELAKHGTDVMVSNFFDDGSHRRTPEASEVAGWFEDAGLVVREAGSIDLGLLGEEMFARNRDGGDASRRLNGFWSMTRWASWVVASKS